MSTNPDHLGKTIVVVDDDISLLQLVSLMLKRIGATTETFVDGMSALQHLENAAPDLIILDLMLPDIEGLEVLKHVRQMPHLSRVPVLILSALVDPAFVRRGMELGADSYLTKPYIATTLLERVRLLLQVGHKSTPPAPPESAGKS